jgi:serine/threonine protein kinase
MRTGPYDLLEAVGRGGMGTVYRAKHRQSGQVVAVKVMAADRAADPLIMRRFEKEFLATRALHHPHIVRGLDFGVDHDRPYLVMEFVDGQNLGTRVREQGPLAESEAVRIFLEVAAGLQVAHQQKFIHRDVKPENILLRTDGVAKLADLGLIKDLEAGASLTRSRTCLGTVGFMAPEQFGDAKHVDPRCDVYGLGGSLYYALTGAVPFPGKGNLAILKKKLAGEFAPPRKLMPALRASVERAVCRALEPSPDRRPTSCAEFSELLSAALAEAPPPPAVLPVDERRNAPRFASALEANCRPLRDSKEQWRAEVQDISLTGIRLELSRRFEPGTALTLEVGDADRDTASLLLVKVRWVRQGAGSKWGVGCSFTKPMTENELSALLDSHPTTMIVHAEAGQAKAV